MEPGSVDIIKKTAISSLELMESIQSIGAQQTLLVLDVCHSGAFGQIKGLNGDKDRDIYGGFESLQYFSSNVSGIAIIASSKKENVSFGFSDGSVFTQFFVNCLKTLSKNEEGVLLLRLIELLQLQMENSPQTPIFKCDNIQNSHKWLIGMKTKRNQKKKRERREYYPQLKIKEGGTYSPNQKPRRPRREKNTPKIIPSNSNEQSQESLIYKQPRTPEKRRKRLSDDDESEKKKKKNQIKPSSPILSGGSY